MFNAPTSADTTPRKKSAHEVDQVVAKSSDNIGKENDPARAEASAIIGEDVGQLAGETKDNVGEKAMSEVEIVRQSLAEERMNRTMSLPECMCLRLPRVLSYAEVGDPSGYPVCDDDDDDDKG